jgi:hypothetical protein
LGGESLTCLAEGIRGGLMTLIDLVALVVIRKIHRGALSGFDYGTGKIEQLCSIGIALGLAAGSGLVGYDAVEMAMRGHSDASPLGLSLAAVVGALNLVVNFISWDSVRQATLGRPSAIMSAQLHARTTKLLASLLVQVTMTVAALAKDPVAVAIADAAGALMVCVVMGHAALRLMLEAVPDLLDPLDRPRGAARARAGVVGPAGRVPLRRVPLARHLARLRPRGDAGLPRGHRRRRGGARRARAGCGAAQAAARYRIVRRGPAGAGDLAAPVQRPVSRSLSSGVSLSRFGAGSRNDTGSLAGKVSFRARSSFSSWVRLRLGLGRSLGAMQGERQPCPRVA